ncbi:hypothetical protein [uncultured Nostoc sp.]|uniref:hypothetical protein n=1 Tax=uncultured Nostoc sp. TaxID=340711 RepID=UPI0035CA9BBB
MSVTKWLEILDFIRELPQQLNLSQKQFAAKVGVTSKQLIVGKMGIQSLHG